MDKFIDLEDVTTTTSYRPITILGKGTYGKVISVLDIANVKAMKLMPYNVDRDNGNIDDYFAICEAYFTRMIKHPNIMTRYEFGFTQKYSYFLMDQADSVFHDVIPKLTVDKMYQYIYQIADTIRYLHEGGFVYCDVKPSNILIIKGVLKISDLGYVKVIENRHDDDYHGSECQTINYRAPEQYIFNERMIKHYHKLFSHKKLMKWATDNVKGEYWSLGILFLDIIYQTPFLTYDGNDQTNYHKSDHLYPMIIGILSENQARDIPPIASLIEIFGMPDEYRLLEVVCDHLLRLNPDERDLDKFINHSIFQTHHLYRAPSSFLYPFTTQMYQGDIKLIKAHQMVVDWIIEISTDCRHPLLITMNAIDLYLQYCHCYSKSEFQAYAIVSIWLVDRLFNPTDEAVAVDNLLYATNNTVSKETFDEMIRTILLTTNGYPVFESLYFYLPNNILVKEGYQRMIKIADYIKYESPRILADQIISEYDGDCKLDRTNIVTYMP